MKKRVASSCPKALWKESVQAGVKGEMIFKETLNRSGIDLPRFLNRLIPSSTKNRFLELDALICAGQKVLCVDVKNYSGRLVWAEDGHTMLRKVEKGWHPLEDLSQKIFNYIALLDKYLSQIDGIPPVQCIPVIAFVDSPDVDISAIHSTDRFIHVSEAPRFISEHAQGVAPVQLIDAIGRLPTWDRIYTVDGADHYGFILDDFVFWDIKAGCERRFPYTEIDTILITNLAIDGLYQIDILFNTPRPVETFFTDSGKAVLNEMWSDHQNHFFQHTQRITVDQRKRHKLISEWQNLANN